MSFHIRNAATLIADIDPACAAAFINQPRNRRLLATAFCDTLANSKTYGHLADMIRNYVMVRIEMDEARTADLESGAF